VREPSDTFDLLFFCVCLSPSKCIEHEQENYDLGILFMNYVELRTFLLLKSPALVFCFDFTSRIAELPINILALECFMCFWKIQHPIGDLDMSGQLRPFKQRTRFKVDASLITA